ncbi:MAG: glycoside hydrolase family 127 protein [Oscillospiraceae bacterium]|jgi:hypothetical protein|nr:glycoside hydrolase family 127 protein [Oscillospiraceae bacterium]
MTNRVFERLTLKDITPQGFLADLLRTQAAGLSGHIHEIWEDLSDNSAWLGGTGEAWERGPYYMDGLLPLALFTNNEKLLADAEKWISAIIAGQREDGFFGPAWNTDWWPRFVVLKALAPYYRATDDARIIPFMEKYFSYMYAQIDAQPPVFWASARALEAAEAIELVYEKTGAKYLLDLTEKLKNYMYDWFSYFESIPYKQPMTAYTNKAVFNFFKNVGEPFDRIRKRSTKARPPKPREKILKFNSNSMVRLISLTHGVNIAMALKYPAVYGMLRGQPELYALSQKGYEQLMQSHGTAIGLWTSDEHLSGPSPTGGTELCTVAEMLYSLEELLSVTGDMQYADLLELIAFNAYPATFTPDMCAHQYVQQANQIAADRKKREFFDTDEEANTFGLAPNFGCCAANMHQGFPKFAGSCCHRTKKGLAFLVYMPCEVTAALPGGKTLRVREVTSYPFADTIEFEILEGGQAEAALQFRVPALTTGELFFNGEPAARSGPGIITLQKSYHEGDKITLKLHAPVTTITNPDGSVSIRRGPLLLALKIEELCNKFSGQEPFHDREFLPASAWNFAPLLLAGKPQVLSVQMHEIPSPPFSTTAPPLTIKLRGVQVHNWKIEKNSAGPYPRMPRCSPPAEITLVPYGCTNLRVAQFPMIEEN